MTKKGIKQIEEIVHLGKADLHIHSNFSDARPSIEEILEYVEEKTDLDVIAICDHNTIDGALKAQEIVKSGNYRFEVIVGEEISTKEGHILGLFLTEAIHGGQTAHTSLRKIKEQGGIAIAAHPFQQTTIRNPDEPMMDGVGLVTLVKEKELFDAIEVVNATPTLGEENLRAEFINRTLLLRGETGSSDAHIKEAIGKGYTLFEGKTAKDLKHALKHHQTQAMYDKWTLFALFRYAFFFIPKGLRMAWYTIIHGRSEKRLQIINIPKKQIEEYRQSRDSVSE